MSAQILEDKKTVDQNIAKNQMFLLKVHQLACFEKKMQFHGKKIG